VALVEQEVYPISSQIESLTPLTPDIEAFNPLNVYPDATGDNSFKVDHVPLSIKLGFKAETDLCFLGIELLSRSFAPMNYSSKFPKRYDAEAILFFG